MKKKSLFASVVLAGGVLSSQLAFADTNATIQAIDPATSLTQETVSPATATGPLFEIKEGQMSYPANYSFVMQSANFSNGNYVATVGAGKYTIFDAAGNALTSNTWQNGTLFGISAAATMSNGFVVLAGGGGNFQIITDYDYVVKSGKWAQGTSLINTAIGLADGRILLAGDSGKYAFMDGYGNSIKYGSWSHGATSITAGTQLADTGNIVLVGSGGKYNILDANGNLIRSATLTYVTTPNAVAQLSNGNIIIAGSSGRYEIINQSGITQYSATWSHGSSYAIQTITSLPSGRVFLGSLFSQYELLYPLGNSAGYGYIRPNTGGGFTLQTSLVTRLGYLMVGGQFGYWKLLTEN
ncbi:hypothetical protein [Tumebacillus permanentifrigoris]|uniref:Uncharacterized protein n=1 Tax=Tumebacillus permanentifrigoris TaxID=378543 RepID=A0A316DYZ5_9BACL|nr:hypothetical protein [Tumebacillus permanentifrigoris]PWK15720.1 hypothetical protein C7459_103272 [Tumebacillus permanentifrigoris]